MPALKRLTSEERKRIIKRVLEDGISVTEACKEFGISRFTFYKWLNRYKSSDKELSEVLKDRNPRGRNHWRSPSANRIKEILKRVRENPEYSSRRIQRELSQDGRSIEISPHGVQSVLDRLGLSRYEDRLEYVGRLNLRDLGKITQLRPQERLSAIKKVLLEGWSVSEVCRIYGISRHTFYKWLRRYEEVGPEEEISALSDKRPSGEQHWKSIDDLTSQRILETVLAEPQLSARQIAKKIGFVSQHGVHNVLLRHSLNTFEKRVAYAQEQAAVTPAVRPEVSWLDRLKLAVQEFLPSRAPAPHPSRITSR